MRVVLPYLVLLALTASSSTFYPALRPDWARVLGPKRSGHSDVQHEIGGFEFILPLRKGATARDDVRSEVSRSRSRPSFRRSGLLLFVGNSIIPQGPGQARVCVYVS